VGLLYVGKAARRRQPQTGGAKPQRAAHRNRDYTQNHVPNSHVKSYIWTPVYTNPALKVLTGTELEPERTCYYHTRGACIQKMDHLLVA
jgi:hypothetical protein